MLRYVICWTIKCLANGLRPVFLAHFWAFPKKRFSIPDFSPALIRARRPKKIPRIIWQTNYSEKVTLSVYCNYLWNRILSPTYEYRFVSNENSHSIIRDSFTNEIYEAYDQIQIGSAKADYWRVLMLLNHGGVYVDIDANLVWPPELFIEPDSEEFFIRTRTGETTNYFMASAPNSPLFQRIEATIRRNIEENVEESVFSMTGPAAIWPLLKDALISPKPYFITCHHGQFVNRKLQYPDSEHDKWYMEQRERSVLR